MAKYPLDRQCPYINAEHRKALGLINAHELTAMLPITKQYAFVRWALDNGMLPKPVRTTGRRCLWDRQEIVLWLKDFDFFSTDYAKQRIGTYSFSSMLEGEHLRLANRFYSVLNELKHE